MEWIAIGELGVVNGERVVTVGAANPAGMKRLLGAVPQEQIIDLTGGRRRQSLLVLDSGHVVISALSVAEVGGLLTAAGNPGAGERQIEVDDE